MKTWVFILFCLSCLLLTPTAWAGDGSGHADPVAQVALALALILVVAKLGGELAQRLGQPAVLGELLAGVVVGNLSLVGFAGFDFIQADPAIDILARIAVLLLLFEVGLESTVGQMFKVGLPALVVALLGVATPFALGWLVGLWLLPQASPYVHVFLGATLTATSVGITARVLQDLGRSKTLDARIILGAAVIDDVLGLIVLAVVTGIITAADAGGVLSVGQAGWIGAKAVLFLAGALFVGVALSPMVFGGASRLQTRGVLLALGLVFCLFLSWLAAEMGLAAIVGAFAAGLILEDAHFKNFTDRGEHSLEDLIKPITSFLVPVFFVVMGMRTDLRSFLQPGILGLAAALTVAAIVGKQACSLGTLGLRIDRLSIGIGMIPRGEVGLIFANIGMSLTIQGERVIDSATYSAVVIMVIVTTLVTPPALKWSLTRASSTKPAG